MLTYIIQSCFQKLFLCNSEHYLLSRFLGIGIIVPFFPIQCIFSTFAWFIISPLVFPLYFSIFAVILSCPDILLFFIFCIASTNSFLVLVSVRSCCYSVLRCSLSYWGLFALFWFCPNRFLKYSFQLSIIFFYDSMSSFIFYILEQIWFSHLFECSVGDFLFFTKLYC